jgi:hypothetical protein
MKNNNIEKLKIDIQNSNLSEQSKEEILKIIDRSNGDPILLINNLLKFFELAEKIGEFINFEDII